MLNKTGMIAGAILVGLLILMALFASILTTHDPIAIDPAVRLSPPTQQNPFGTDNLGRDMLSRILYGWRTTLFIGFLAMLIALVAGAILGMAGGVLEDVAGSFGKVVNKVFICTARFLSAGPGILLAIAIAVASVYNRGGYLGRATGIALLLVPGFIRVFGGVAPCFRDKTVKHAILMVLAQISLSIALAILVCAGLGYLGLVVQPPTPELGALIGSSREFLRVGSYLLLFPGLLLGVSALSFNILGESLNAHLLVVHYKKR